eukprot:jgi/Psemu1/54690/gm1.54690_g
MVVVYHMSSNAASTKLIAKGDHGETSLATHQKYGANPIGLNLFANNSSARKSHKDGNPIWATSNNIRIVSSSKKDNQRYF